MNANHARPMLAFWLLAAVAAVVTGVGLHEGGARVRVQAGPPSPVRVPDSAPLVLGGNLRPVPTLAGTPTSTLPSVASLQGAVVHTAVPAVEVLAPGKPAKAGATTRTRASGTSTAQPTAPHRPSGSTAAAPTSPVAPAPGPGSSHGHGNGHGHGPGGVQSAAQLLGPGSSGHEHGHGHEPSARPSAPGRSGR